MEVLKYAFLFLLPGIVYFLLFKKNKIVLWSLKDFKNKLICFFLKDKMKKYKEKYGKIVSGLGDNLESEINILTDKDSECQYFYGVDQYEKSLMLKIELFQNAVASIILHLRIGKNKYVLEGKRGCCEVNLPKSRWKINGLNIEVLEPFKRLRITYNGLLRNTSQRDSIEHVRFNFIFVAASSPQFVPQNIPDNFLSKYLQTKDPDDINSVYADQYGLSQFGVLKGTVKIESSKEFILNLPTCRSRFKGTDDKFSSRKVIKIVAIDEYGNFFEIVLKWFEDGISKLKYGFAYLSTEKRYPITKMDIADPYVIREDFKTNISVKVNKKIYKIAINLDKESSLKSLNFNKFGYEVYSVQGHCKINNFAGRAIVELWNDYQGSSEFLPELKLCEKHEENLPEIFICDLKNEESQILDLTGGKGCSLALLTSLNSSLFTVPEGFIVTVKAYQAHIQENQSLVKSVSILNDICCGKLDEKLEEACKRTVTSFKNQQMSQNLKDQIITQINKYTKEDFVGWAVRSSGIVEDSEEFSAAGQNETFLGCQTEDKIIKSVLACWASLYTYQSILYRWQHGLPVITDIAVVVQKMVRAESAGVLFTCHPSTCNPGQMVITSNFGLGETVVSGESDPDTFILKRTWDNEMTVLSKTLGSKNKVLKMTENGVQESTSEAMNSNLSSLTDSQAIEIGKVGLYLENVFGNPRDIEWGFYKDKLYLFQSRPITTLNNWTDFELSHEFDAPFLTSNSISTTANIREVVPRAVTVLTRSSSLRAMDWALQKHVQKNFDPATLRGLITYQHNLFLNVLTSIYMHASEEVLPSDVTVDLAIFGHPVIDKNINEIAKNIHGVSSGLEKFKEILRSLPIAWKNRKHLEMSRKLVENMNLEASTDEELYEKIDLAIGDVEKASIIHSMTSRSSVFYQICTMNVLLERNKEILTKHMSDFALILSSCEDVISAEVPKYLEGISKIIKENGCTDVFQNIDPSQGFEWLKNNCKEAFELYLEFIEKHGHRSFAEFEINEPTWKDNPEKVISMIQANVGAERKEKINLEVEEIIDKLQSPKSNITRAIVKFLTKKIRVAVGIREQTKSYLVKSIDYLRKGYRKLGDHMVARGLLPSKDLIFHLTHYEIGLILQNRDPSLITKAVRRQKLYNTWNKMKFSEINYGVPEPDDDSDIPVVNPKEVCKGTPVCRGVVQARACVIRTLDEIHTLKSGDILITYSTDIGWSPYFPMLSGVVTELGGLVSHDHLLVVIVIREFYVESLEILKNGLQVPCFGLSK